MIYECEIPFPPSVNSAFGNRSNQKRFKSKQYKAWEKACPELVLPECGSIEFPIHVEYKFIMPDRRKRDLSNYVKLPEDYLVSQGVLWDDNHTIINSFTVTYGGTNRDESRVEITITEARDG